MNQGGEGNVVTEPSISQVYHLVHKKKESTEAATETVALLLITGTGCHHSL
jgi:hypothetical protein